MLGFSGQLQNGAAASAPSGRAFHDETWIQVADAVAKIEQRLPSLSKKFDRILRLVPAGKTDHKRRPALYARDDLAGFQHAQHAADGRNAHAVLPAKLLCSGQ